MDQFQKANLKCYKEPLRALK